MMTLAEIRSEVEELKRELSQKPAPNSIRVVSDGGGVILLNVISNILDKIEVLRRDQLAIAEAVSFNRMGPWNAD